MVFNRNIYLITFLIFVIQLDVVAKTCLLESLSQRVCEILKSMPLDEMLSIDDTEEEKKQKTKKRKNFADKRENKKIPFENITDIKVGKKIQVKIPRGSKKKKFHIISDIKEGVDQAKYRFVKKVSRQDKVFKRQRRPNYIPYLEEIRYKFSFKILNEISTSTREREKIYIKFHYDNAVSANYTATPFSEQEPFFIGNERNETEYNSFVMTYFGEYIPVESKVEQDFLLRNYPYLYYKVVKAPEKIEKLEYKYFDIKEANPSFQGNQLIIEEIIQKPQFLIAISFYLDSPKGTQLEYSIDKFKYTFSISGLMDRVSGTDPDVDAKLINGKLKRNPCALFKVEDQFDMANSYSIRNQWDPIAEHRKPNISHENEENKVISLKPADDNEHTGTGIVLDTSGSLMGKPGEKLKLKLIELVSSFEKGKDFQILYQVGGGIRRIKKISLPSNDPRYELEKESIIEKIEKIVFFNGESKIIHSVKAAIENKKLSHIYIFTDGKIMDSIGIKKYLRKVLAENIDLPIINVFQVNHKLEMPHNQDLVDLNLMIREENLQLKQAKIEKNISRIKKSEEIIQRLTQEYQYQLKVSLDNSNTREKALNLLVNASGGRVIYIDHIEKIGD